MRYAVTTISLLLVLTTVGHAEVMATNIGLLNHPTLGTNSYVIPKGKVLIIEHVWCPDPNSLVALVLEKPWGPLEIPIAYAKERGLTSFTPTLKLYEGTLKLNWFGGPLEGGGAEIFGLLADTGDLYAAIPSEFEAASLANGSLRGILRLHSPRPSVLKLESATDLVTWDDEREVVFAALQDRSRRHLTVPISGERGFYRAKARARRE